MGVTHSDKELNPSTIVCGGSFKVKLSLTAEPNIAQHPTDIVLVLDRSMSMSGSSLESLKKGAKKFIDIIDESTDGEHNGEIGLGSRIGIVSFAENAVQNTPLITSADDLKVAVESLTAGGRTNHFDAFNKAMQTFDNQSANEKVIVMFTDGRTTAGENPNPVAQAAKEQGVTIYCIGLSGNGGVDETALREWASSPDSSYVAITPDEQELENIFGELAKNISKPGATNIVITDKVTSCFKIVSADTPTKGTASLIDSRTLEWKIAELGVKKSEGASLEFTVQHVGSCTGSVEVNESVSYSDKEKNKVSFPSPKIEVDCSTEVITEGCPTPIDVTIGGCEDALVFDAGKVEMESLGRILQLDVTLKNVCPYKRVALATIVTEVDSKGKEYKRGVKTLVIPAHTRQTCRDITVRCIKFVLPESLDVSESADSICNSRKFKVRFISNYIDSDFACCNVILQ